jgi:hypothetical protein
MFLSPNLTQLIFKRALPLFNQATLLEIRYQGVRRRSGINVLEEAVDVVASDAEVFELGLEERDVV